MQAGKHRTLDHSMDGIVRGKTVIRVYGSMACEGYYQGKGKQAIMYGGWWIRLRLRRLLRCGSTVAIRHGFLYGIVR